MPLYPPAGSGGGAPTTVEYLVGATDGTLSAERVVTDTAGADGVTWDLATGGQAKANATNAGKWKKLATATASASATVDFTGLSSAYNEYLVVFSNVAPATDGVNLWMRTSTNNGSSYDNSGSDYVWGDVVVTAPNGSIGSSGATAAQIQLGFDTYGNAANEEGSGEVKIFQPSAARYCKVLWTTNSHSAGTYYDADFGIGVRLAAADVDAVRFMFSSGNIASGQFDLYGLAS